MLPSMFFNSSMLSAVTRHLIPILREMMAYGMSTSEFSETSTGRRACQNKFVAFMHATKKGQRPEGLNASPKWHQNISLATNLLEKNTRSTAFKFESSMINKTIE